MSNLKKLEFCEKALHSLEQSTSQECSIIMSALYNIITVNKYNETTEEMEKFWNDAQDHLKNKKRDEFCSLIRDKILKERIKELVKEYQHFKKLKERFKQEIDRTRNLYERERIKNREHTTLIQKLELQLNEEIKRINETYEIVTTSSKEDAIFNFICPMLKIALGERDVEFKYPRLDSKGGVANIQIREKGTYNERGFFEKGRLLIVVEAKSLNTNLKISKTSGIINKVDKKKKLKDWMHKNNTNGITDSEIEIIEEKLDNENVTFEEVKKYIESIAVQGCQDIQMIHNEIQSISAVERSNKGVQGNHYAQVRDDCTQNDSPYQEQEIKPIVILTSGYEWPVFNDTFFDKTGNNLDCPIDPIEHIAQNCVENKEGQWKLVNIEDDNFEEKFIHTIRTLLKRFD